MQIVMPIAFRFDEKHKWHLVKPGTSQNDVKGISSCRSRFIAWDTTTFIELQDIENAEDVCNGCLGSFQIIDKNGFSNPESIAKKNDTLLSMVESINEMMSPYIQNPNIIVEKPPLAGYGDTVKPGDYVRVYDKDGLRTFSADDGTGRIKEETDIVKIVKYDVKNDTVSFSTGLWADRIGYCGVSVMKLSLVSFKKTTSPPERKNPHVPEFYNGTKLCKSHKNGVRCCLEPGHGWLHYNDTQDIVGMWRKGDIGPPPKWP